MTKLNQPHRVKDHGRQKKGEIATPRHWADDKRGDARQSESRGPAEGMVEPRRADHKEEQQHQPGDAAEHDQFANKRVVHRQSDRGRMRAINNRVVGAAGKLVVQPIAEAVGGIIQALVSDSSHVFTEVRCPDVNDFRDDA